jgi:hypothetical protein
LNKIRGSDCWPLIDVNFDPVAREVKIVGVLQSLCHLKNGTFLKAGIKHLRYLVRAFNKWFKLFAWVGDHDVQSVLDLNL